MKPKYIIIAGSTKCGTTSLFDYLTSHPDIAAPYTKETRFFLDEEYPLPRYKQFSGGEQDYYSLFVHSGAEKFFCEATPDYLYSKETPQRIISTLGNNCLVIFLLRDKVERFMSWHRHAIQTGLIKKDTSLKNFLALQHKHPSFNYTTAQHTMAFCQGHYDYYLHHWKKALPQQQLMIIKTEELASAPRETMRKICDRAGIEYKHYETYKFKKSNKSKKPRSTTAARLYYSVSRILRNYIGQYKLTKALLRPTRKAIEMLIFDKRNAINDNEKHLVASNYNEGQKQCHEQ